MFSTGFGASWSRRKLWAAHCHSLCRPRGVTGNPVQTRALAQSPSQAMSLAAAGRAASTFGNGGLLHLRAALQATQQRPADTMVLGKKSHKEEVSPFASCHLAQSCNGDAK